MNWIQNLAETYDQCKAELGYNDQGGNRPLLPICHITVQAHVEVVLNSAGVFRRAYVITEKKNATTIIPCTEKSGSKSGKAPVNHPLCDKLQYLAGDFVQHGGDVTSGFAKDPEEPFRKYVELLTEWSGSKFSHPKLVAILKYVEARHLVGDLIRAKIFFVDENQQFLSKEETNRDKNSKDIFSVIASQEDAVVRWVVEDPISPESRVWRDKDLWESWVNFYLQRRNELSLCLASGEECITTSNHPKYIRREGDNAKIISANDTSGYTFRGRFLLDSQAYGLGLEASHKAHNALSWLISRQGYRKGDLAVVAWATSGASVPQPTDDPIDILYKDAEIEENHNASTAQEISIQLRNRIAGYASKMGRTENVAVMALDSATPGRLSIIYYRDLLGSDFLGKINDWHTTCAWLHQYRSIPDETAKNKKRYVAFFGAPAPSDIAEAAYGLRVDDKLRSATISRLLPCIIDGQPLPRDLVEATIRRASNRAGLDEWDWNKTLSIACSLFKKFKKGKEDFDMALDKTRTQRDYLYGRLLAIADVMEERALYKSGQKRATNAARYMQQFSQRPFRTWKQIHDALAPYILQLGGAHYYKGLIAEVESLFVPEDFISNKPLSGEYLLGYYCQRQELQTKNEKTSTNEVEEDAD